METIGFRPRAAKYVRGDAHTNGIESFRAMLKRGIMSTFHPLSPKHQDRYVTEFAARHSDRNADTMDRMALMVREWSGGACVRCADLAAD